jgi:hypothetical protein
LGSEFPNIFCFASFRIIRFQKTFEKKLRAGRSAGSPQSGYSLVQLTRFGYRVSKHFLFRLICDYDYKTSGDLRQKLRAWTSAGSPQSLYSLAQLTHFGFRVSKHFLFCLIWDYKTSRDFRKKLRAGRSAGSPKSQSGYSLVKWTRFGFRISRHFLFWNVLNKLQINCLTMNFEYYKLYITSTQVRLPPEFKHNNNGRKRN